MLCILQKLLWESGFHLLQHWKGNLQNQEEAAALMCNVQECPKNTTQYESALGIQNSQTEK